MLFYPEKSLLLSCLFHRTAIICWFNPWKSEFDRNIHICCLCSIPEYFILFVVNFDYLPDYWIAAVMQRSQITCASHAFIIINLIKWSPNTALIILLFIDNILSRTVLQRGYYIAALLVVSQQKPVLPKIFT